jgi:hypothetical protein
MTWYAGNNSTNNGSFGWLFEAAASAVNLIGDDITAGVPVVGSPSLAQEHVFDGNDVTTGQPTVGASDIAQEHDLNLTVTLSTTINADDITTGQPTLGASSIAPRPCWQRHHDRPANAITTMSEDETFNADYCVWCACHWLWCNLRKTNR